MQADAEVLEQEVGDAEGDIDFFLTAEWPAGVTALCPPGSAPEQEVPGMLVHCNEEYFVHLDEDLSFKTRCFVSPSRFCPSRFIPKSPLVMEVSLMLCRSEGLPC